MDWWTGQGKKSALSEGVQKKDTASVKVCLILPILPDQAEYSPQEREQTHEMVAKGNSEGWFIILEGRFLIPEKTATGLVRLAHDIIHLGKTSLQRLLQKYLVIPQLATLTRSASKACLHGTQHNLGQGPKPLLLFQKKGVYPFQHLEMDFTEIQPSKTYQDLLVVVCTFTGWDEAYPTCTEKATEVSRALAREIIPRFGVPSSIGSDNGPAFISQVVKGVSHAVRLTWDFHTRYHHNHQVKWKDEQDYQDSTSKTMSRDRATLARCTTIGTVQN
jgi:hypothetical protein